MTVRNFCKLYMIKGPTSTKNIVRLIMKNIRIEIEEAKKKNIANINYKGIENNNNALPL